MPNRNEIILDSNNEETSSQKLKFGGKKKGEIVTCRLYVKKPVDIA